MKTNLVLADSQAIDSRFGEAIWLTSFITPDNPEVMLKYQQITEGLMSSTERIFALWQYVASIPYRETIKAKITINGRTKRQSDCWLYPAEVIALAPVANCANKSFLLTSLLMNELPPSDVRCVLGHISLDGIGAHAWVEVNIEGTYQILESTVTDPQKAMVPVHLATIYDPVIYFTDESVYNVIERENSEAILNERFGFCAIPYLSEYICERCLQLEV